MNRIDATFQQARAQRRAAFIPFLTAGDPDLPTTLAAARAVLAEGERANVPMLLELGFPYSDPIADGPTIQASYTRALDKGITIAQIFGLAKELRQGTEAGLVGMVSFSLVHRAGMEAFAKQAKAAGLDGLIIPDLPIDEAADMHAVGRAHDLKIVQLVAPTTPEPRAKQIVQQSTGFVYCVAIAGITGARAELPADLVTRVQWLRGQTDTPIAVGFGISTAAQVQAVAAVADGVIVGSALVKRVAEVTADNVAPVAAFVADLLG